MISQKGRAILNQRIKLSGTKSCKRQTAFSMGRRLREDRFRGTSEAAREQILSLILYLNYWHQQRHLHIEQCWSYYSSVSDMLYARSLNSSRHLRAIDESARRVIIFVRIFLLLLTFLQKVHSL